MNDQIRKLFCNTATQLILGVLLLGMPVVLLSQEGETPTAEHGVADSPRELFGTMGINDSFWNFLADGEDLGAEEHEILYRLLFRLPSIPRDRLHDWATPPDWEALLEEPAAHQGDVILFHGTLVEMEVLSVIPEQQERLRFSEFYRLRLSDEKTGHQVELFCRKVPKAWLEVEDREALVGQPVSGDLIFLKRGERLGDHPSLVMATHRLAWHPSKENVALGVTESQVRLASLGMDIGLLDTVRHGREISHSDRDCFYQMLAALGRADRETFEGESEPMELTETSLSTWVQEPKEMTGERVVFRGSARRVQRIEVEDRDIQRLYGIDHYYEIDALFRLKEGYVRYEIDGEERLYSEYPIVICTRELPRDMPMGSNLSEPIIVTGYYFKLYAYRSHIMDRVAQGEKQLSPLIISRKPVWDRVEPVDHSREGMVIGLLFVVALVGMWIGVWRYNRGDREFDRSALARQYDLPAEQSLDDLDLESMDRKEGDESSEE